MKRLVSIILMSCLTISLIADEVTSAPTTKDNSASQFVAVSANYSLMSINSKTDKTSIDSHTDGFTFGVLFNLPLTKHVITNFGAQYQFGYAENTDYGVTCKGYEHDIKIPVKFGYSTDFGKKSQVCVYAGPSFLFCVSAPSETSSLKIDAISGKYESTIRGNKTSGTLKKYQTMNVFDLQLGLGAMLRFGVFGLRIEYDWGVLNRAKNQGSAKSYESQLTAGIMLAF